MNSLSKQERSFRENSISDYVRIPKRWCLFQTTLNSCPCPYWERLLYAFCAHRWLKRTSVVPEPRVRVLLILKIHQENKVFGVYQFLNLFIQRVFPCTRASLSTESKKYTWGSPTSDITKTEATKSSLEYVQCWYTHNSARRYRA